MASVLLDTGPLVALFKRNDTHHQRAALWFKAHRGALLTTQAVVTEAWHLVSESARLSMVRFVLAACEIREFDAQGQARVVAMLVRYADLPMDYADATLLALGEIEKISAVATIDVNDFSVYRMANGKSLTLVF